MEIRIERETSIVQATPGVLFVDGVRECFTLEDPIREKRYEDGALVDVAAWKIAGQTAIPSGRYAVIIDYSARFKRLMPHILAVPGFSGVRIHYGNTAADTEGCVLVGSERQSQSTILYSRLAFEHLFTKLSAADSAGAGIWITIENPRVEPSIARV